jgi:hypothetical protein
MNAEITKAIKEKNKKHPIRKWWNKNGYKVMRVIFFPIWIGMVAKDKINEYLASRQKWSDERAKEILNYYVPRRADWCEEDKTFYFFDNGMGWGNLAKSYLKLKDRRWWNNYNGFRGGEIRLYLIEEFELEGFTKEVIRRDEAETEITFTLIENN